MESQKGESQTFLGKFLFVLGGISLGFGVASTLVYNHIMRINAVNYAKKVVAAISSFLLVLCALSKVWGLLFWAFYPIRLVRKNLNEPMITRNN